MKGSMIGKETPRKPPIVLVVDDESAIVAAFSETLQLDGYEAVPAHSAEDGLRLLDDGLMPDAVLLDLRMPGMGGLGFLLSLRAHPDRQKIPVAVVTADTHLDDTAQEAVQALGADLCFKPMTMQDVLTLAARLHCAEPGLREPPTASLNRRTGDRAGSHCPAAPTFTFFSERHKRTVTNLQVGAHLSRLGTQRRPPEPSSIHKQLDSL